MKDLSKILELIPQRLPMVMVDEHISTDEKLTITKFKIEQDSFFTENGILSEAGILENMAQSAATRLGYSFILKKSGNPPIGIIASMQDIEIFCYPKIEQEITTEVLFVDEIMGITLVNCETKIDDKIIAKCKMKILLRE